MALVASLAMVFSFAVPAQAATTVTQVVLTTGGGTAIGPVGGATSVTITGTGFDLSKTFGANPDYVKFGANNPTTYTVVSATQITATSPASTGGAAGAVTVTVGTIDLLSAFTYVAAPTVTAASPTTGPLGGTNTVVITGTNFVNVTAVTFGGTAATSYVVNSATQITAVAPARASGAAGIAVTAAGGLGSPAAVYTYVSSPPTITSIGTRSGPLTGATTVVITGTNFHGVVGSAAVKFGANNATSYTVNSTTQITAVAPAGLAGTVNVLVTAVDGTATLGSAYTYRAVSTVTNASERVFFAPGRSEIRSSQYEAFAAIALATEGKTGIRIVVTSRRWSGNPSRLGVARNNSVVRLLELVGLEGANVTYTRFNTKATAGGSSADKNNRVSIAVTWTN
jgi:hypothetical protein